jgi:CRP-like cAMP-binding protein
MRRRSILLARRNPRVKCPEIGLQDSQRVYAKATFEWSVGNRKREALQSVPLRRSRLRRKVVLMSRLGKSSFDIVAFNTKFGGLTKSRHAENHTIYRQGSVGDAVFHILDGGVKLTVVSAKGKERVVAIHGPGDFFGQASLTGHRPRIASAITITKCEFVRLELAAISSALCEDLSFSTFFVSFLLERNARLVDDLVDQLFHSSEQRLARLLLLLADQQGEPQFATL